MIDEHDSSQVVPSKRSKSRVFRSELMRLEQSNNSMDGHYWRAAVNPLESTHLLEEEALSGCSSSPINPPRNLDSTITNVDVVDVDDDDDDDDDDVDDITILSKPASTKKHARTFPHPTSSEDIQLWKKRQRSHHSSSSNNRNNYHHDINNNDNNNNNNKGKKKQKHRSKRISKEEIDDLRDSIRRMDGSYWTGGSVRNAIEHRTYPDVYQTSLLRFQELGMEPPLWFRLFHRHWQNNQRLRDSPMRWSKLRWFRLGDTSKDRHQERAAELPLVARIQADQYKMFPPTRPRSSASRHLVIHDDDDDDDDNTDDENLDANPDDDNDNNAMEYSFSSLHTLQKNRRHHTSSSTNTIASHPPLSIKPIRHRLPKSPRQRCTSLQDWFKQLPVTVSPQKSLFPTRTLAASASASSLESTDAASQPTDNFPDFFDLLDDDSPQAGGAIGLNRLSTYAAHFPASLKLNSREYASLLPPHHASLSTFFSQNIHFPDALNLMQHSPQDLAADIDRCFDAYQNGDHATAQMQLYRISAWLNTLLHGHQSLLPFFVPLPELQGASVLPLESTTLHIIGWADRLRIWLDGITPSAIPHDFLAQSTLLLMVVCTFVWLAWIRHHADPSHPTALHDVGAADLALAESGSFMMDPTLRNRLDRIDQIMKGFTFSLMDLCFKAFGVSSGFFSISLPPSLQQNLVAFTRGSHQNDNHQAIIKMERPFAMLCVMLAQFVDLQEGGGPGQGSFWHLFNQRIDHFIPADQAEQRWEALYMFASIRIAFDSQGQSRVAHAPTMRGAFPANWALMEAMLKDQLRDFASVKDDPRSDEVIKRLLLRVFHFSTFWVLSDNKIIELLMREYFLPRWFHDHAASGYNSHLLNYQPQSSLTINLTLAESTHIDLYLYLLLRRIADVATPLEASRLSSLFLLQMWDRIPTGPDAIIASELDPPSASRLTLCACRNILSLLIVLTVLMCRVQSYGKHASLIMLRLKDLIRFEQSCFLAQREIIRGYLIIARILKLHGESLQDLAMLINERMATLCLPAVPSQHHLNKNQRELFLVEYFASLSRIYEIKQYRFTSAESTLLAGSVYGALLSRFAALSSPLKRAMFRSMTVLLRVPESVDPPAFPALRPRLSSNEAPHSELTQRELVNPVDDDDDDLDAIFSTLDEEALINGKYFEEQLALHLCNLPLLGILPHLSGLEPSLLDAVLGVLSMAFFAGIRFKRVGWTLEGLVAEFGPLSRWYAKDASRADRHIPLRFLVILMQLGIDHPAVLSGLSHAFFLATWLCQMLAPSYTLQRRFTGYLLRSSVASQPPSPPLAALARRVSLAAGMDDASFFAQRSELWSAVVGAIPRDFHLQPLLYQLSKDQHVLSRVDHLLLALLDSDRSAEVECGFQCLQSLFTAPCIANLHAIHTHTSLFKTIVDATFLNDDLALHPLTETALPALFAALSEIPFRLDTLSYSLQVLEYQSLKRRTRLSVVAHSLLAMHHDSTLFSCFWAFIFPCCLEKQQTWEWSVPLLDSLIRDPGFSPTEIDLAFVTYALITGINSAANISHGVLYVLVRLAWGYCLLSTFELDQHLSTVVVLVILRALQLLSPRYPNQALRGAPLATAHQALMSTLPTLRTKVHQHLHTQNSLFVANAKSFSFMSVPSDPPKPSSIDALDDQLLICVQILFAHFVVDSPRPAVRAIGEQHAPQILPLLRSFTPKSPNGLIRWQENMSKYFP